METANFKLRVIVRGITVATITNESVNAQAEQLPNHVEAAYFCNSELALEVETTEE